MKLYHLDIMMMMMIIIIIICEFFIIYRWILLRMGYISDKFVEKTKKHNLLVIYCCKNHAVYENMQKYGRERQTGHRWRCNGSIIRRMRFECWVTKATKTTCNNYSFSNSTIVSLTRLEDSFHVICLIIKWILFLCGNIMCVETVLLTFRVFLLYIFSDRSRFHVYFAYTEGNKDQYTGVDPSVWLIEMEVG